MVDEETRKRILADYKGNRQNYKVLVSKLKQLLAELLHDHGIIVHSISGRTKSRKSLAGKLIKTESNYKNLTDLTDLAGLRIITYFSEDVDRVAEIMKIQFDIDTKHSIDKRRSLAADRFGYLSLHQVFSLKDSRCELPEYKPFKDIQAELQIRSILQHAWAEIEHDLGYKNEIEVPQHIRRRFARTASILELADDEFKGIKKELENYRKELLTTVTESPEEVNLNLDSIQALVNSDPTIQRIDNEIISIAGTEFKDEYALSGYLKRLQNLGFKTISDVTTALIDNEKLILNFAKKWMDAGEWVERRDSTLLPHGISLFYLWLILLSTREQEEVRLAYGNYIGQERTYQHLIDIGAEARREMNEDNSEV